MTPSIDQTLHLFANLLPNWTLIPILTLLPNVAGFHRTLQRVRLANRGRLLLRTPGPVPFGLAFVLMKRPFFSELVMSTDLLSYKYPSVLLFCFVWRHLFRKYFRYARRTSFKLLKLNFSAVISNIYAQFAPVNRGLNSAYFMPKHFFQKYFRYARMTSLKFSKLNFSAAISNIYAQYAPVNRGLNSAYFMPKQLFESASGMRKWRHLNFQSLISPLL